MTEAEKLELFCRRYDISNSEVLGKLYDINELITFLPQNPTPEDKLTLQELIGVEGALGYMDYIESNNTFELIMQWRERTGKFG